MDLEYPSAGPIGPADDGLDAPFWEGLAAGDLRLPRCGQCQLFVWPAQWTCPACPDQNLDTWVTVEPAGVVYAWTRTWHPFSPEFVDHLPYTVVLVEIDGTNGRRLLGILADEPPVRIGDPVVGVIQPPSDRTGGVAVLRWKKASR
jgi:uncharacterized protein